MKKYLVMMLICFSFYALAQEFPYIPGVTNITPNTQASLENDQEAWQPFMANQPVWYGLMQMSTAERENSHIELILERNATPEALQKSVEIASLWNNGNFTEALALFPELENITNINQMAIGNSWRTPVPTEDNSRWGSDARIGNRDSVLVTALDIHRATGNLFAILLLEGDGNTNRWDVYLSTDGGETWNETYDWWANYDINDLSASVVAGHCYVGFSRGLNQDQAFLYRFNALTGQQENFSNGSSFITVFTTTSPEEIMEVSLSSNQDYFNNRLYYAALSSQGNLKFFWDDPEAISWTEITTNITNADRGLDITSNENYSMHYLWASYIDQNDVTQIDAVNNSDIWEGGIINYAVGTSTDITSISAYNDTITCFFDYHGANLHCRYLVRYGQDNGGAWYWGFMDDTTITAESPAVTARVGGGVGVAYRFYTSPRQERFNWRFYRGSWGSSVSIADHEPYWNRPAIENLGGDVYGVVYLSWSSPYVRAAYFDRSDWVGIEDEPAIATVPAEYALSQNYPNPFNPVTQIQYTLPKESNVILTIYNQLGQEVVTLVKEKQSAGPKTVQWNAASFSSGVYFYRLQAEDYSMTRKMVLLK